MIRSMTGYGGYKDLVNSREYSVDIKSVNHRYLEINLRMPKEFMKFESDIKNFISKYVNRGKVDVFIVFRTYSQDDYKIVPNIGIMKRYYEAINIIRENFVDVQDDFSLSNLIKLPEALIIENQELDNDIIKNELLSCLKMAITNLNRMRENEGQIIKNDITKRIEKLKYIVREIEENTSGLVETYKERLYKRIYENLDIKNIDENRLMLEVTLFADKSDITEEIVRLKSHIEQFEKSLMEGGAIGKKLDFILQEMNREANTIASKSIIFNISNCIVNLKDELEKIREQVQNIE